jgi:hypothetical protein
MYPIEKYMKILKIYVLNMARLEGYSMAKGYIRDENFGFITEYLKGFEVVQPHIWDVEEEGHVGKVLESDG